MPELSRQSGKLDINIEDGIDFNLEAIYKINGIAVDVTGYTAVFEIRDLAGSSDPLLTLTESAGVIVGTTDGKFLVKITDTQAAFGTRELHYDFTVINGTTDIKLLRGKCFSWAKGD